MKKCIFALLPFSLFCFCGTAFASPYVTNVIVRQQWPWSPKINVDFALAGASVDAPVDIAVTANCGGEAIALGDTGLSGERLALTEDKAYRLVLDPEAVPALKKKGLVPQFSLSLTPVASDTNVTGEVLYKIFCLTDNTVTNVTRAELLNGKYGAVETSLDWISNSSVKTNANARPIVWTGVTNSTFYFRNAIVLRKIPADSFKMGSVSEVGTGSGDVLHTVTLSHDFWIGVFEITQAQWSKVMGTWPRGYAWGGEYRPANQLSYLDIRELTNYFSSYDAESANRMPEYGWPSNSTPENPVVSGWSFMGKMRTRFPGTLFDLPTEAQWEYACRAGTTEGHWNDGSLILNSSIDTNLNNLARYAYDGGFCSSNSLANPGQIIYYADPTWNSRVNGTAAVGSYRPNAWGLYDMHGNVEEWCLDGCAAYTADAKIDPPGPIANGKRVMRGGTEAVNPYQCRSAARDTGTFDYYRYAFHGLRLAIPHAAQ